MSEENPRSRSYRVLVGLLVATFGVLLFLDRMYVLEFGGFERWWPLILVGFGLWKLAETPAGEHRGGARWMILIGGVFLIKPVLRLVSGDDPLIDAFRIWPLLIIAGGAAIIWGAFAPSSRRKGDSTDAS